MEEAKGNIFEIERYALYDGPGIRTVIFLKGCPLRCLWCANPESQSTSPELWYWQDKCIGCGECLESCPNHALEMGKAGVEIDHAGCKRCGKCTFVCPADALAMAGRWMSVEETMREILKDASFYEESGGGVTFSGGEALLQAEFVAQVAKQCMKQGISTCMETSGYAPWVQMEKAVQDIDLVLYDFKQMDPKLHSKQTGVDNKSILENFKKLARLGKHIVVRIPVVPGYNDKMENFQAILHFLQENTFESKRIDLLPYHRLGITKYKRLLKTYPMEDVLPPTPEKMEAIKHFFEMQGFDVSIGG